MTRPPLPSRDQFGLFDETTSLRQTRYMEDLPDAAHTLIEVIGLQATIDLVKAHGGDEIKVPAVVEGNSRAWAMLDESIGPEAARRLVESRFKGTPVYVPLCTAALLAARDREIVRRINAGEPFDQVRSSHRMSRSWLYRLLKQHGSS